MSDTDESISVEPPASRDLDARAMKAQVAANLFGDLASPLVIDRYEVLESLGAGGMGQVYAAWDETLGRKVAIKVLPVDRVSDPRERARLVREAQALAKISHPNVVHVYEVVEHPEGVFIAMELVEGNSLRHWQGQQARSLPELLDVYIQAGRGLHDAHQAGLVHRDFKPSNVLVGLDGRVRVVDFGLAQGPGLRAGSTSATGRSLTASPAGEMTKTGALAGTPAYMAPEQFVGEPADARSDQFSFCVALYEALVGCRPFERAALARTAERPLPAPTRGQRRLPWLMTRAVVRGLAAEPAQRWPDMQALLHALEARTRWRRRFMTWAGPVLLAIGAAALASTREQTCDAPSDGPEAEWNETKRTQVEDAVRSTGLPFTDQTWGLIETRLDRFATQWSEAHINACRTMDAQQFADATECLEDASAGFSAVIESLETSDRETVIRAQAVLDTLSYPTDCLRTAPGDSRETPPSPEVIRILKRARVDLVQGRNQQVLDTLGGLSDDHELPAGTTPWSQSNELRGRALAKLGRFEEAQLVLAETIERAPAGEIKVRAYLAQLELLLEREHWTSARNTAQHVAFAIENLAPSPKLEADLLDLRGTLAAQGTPVDLDAAEDLHKKALELREEHEVSGIAGSTARLAGVYADRGETDRARQFYEKARQIQEVELGTEHPEYGATLFNLGLLDVEAQDNDAARSHFERALKIQRTAYGDDSSVVARVEVMLAQSLLVLRQTEPALEHARAAWTVQKRLPIEHSDRLAALQTLASCEQDAEHFNEALALHRQLHDEYSLDGEPAVLQNIAWLHCEVGRCSEARAWVDKARPQISAQRAQLDELDEVSRRQSELQLHLLTLYVDYVDVLIADAEEDRDKARLLAAQLREQASALVVGPDEQFAQSHIDKLVEALKPLQATLDSAP